MAKPPVVEFIECHPKTYTKGRFGNRIKKIVVHYTGGRGNAHDNLVYFSRQTKRKVSCHYFIGKDGDLRQSVREEHTAWHAGCWTTNMSSIGIECCSNGEPFTEPQILTLGALVGDLMYRYGIAARDVIRHYDVTRRLCPAPYIDAERWRELHARITGASAASTGDSGRADGDSAAGPGLSDNVSDLAQRVINGEFGNGDARRAALGSRYDEVQAEVNRILGYGGSASPQPDRPANPPVDLDAIARRVIDGEFGNGAERRRRLGALYGNVQRRVNEILGQ